MWRSFVRHDPGTWRELEPPFIHQLLNISLKYKSWTIPNKKACPLVIWTLNSSLSAIYWLWISWFEKVLAPQDINFFTCPASILFVLVNAFINWSSELSKARSWSSSKSNLSFKYPRQLLKFTTNFRCNSWEEVHYLHKLALTRQSSVHVCIYISL